MAEIQRVLRLEFKSIFFIYNSKKLLFHILFLVSILSFSGCKSIFQSGLYERCEVDEQDCQQIHFAEDSTFKSYLSYHIGGCCSIVKGTYTLKSDTLILNSYYQPRSPKVEYNSTDSDSKKIRISEFDDSPIKGAAVRINNENSVLVTNRLGIIDVDKDSIGSIQIFFIGIDEREILFKKPYSSKFQIKIELSYNDFFVDKKFILRRNKIYLLKQDGSSHKGMKKLTIKNKKHSF